MPSVDPSPGPSSLAPSKPFSISLSTKPKPKPNKSTPKPASASPSGALNSVKKRPHSALADPDSDPEDDAHGRHETVIGFSNDGKAISVADASKKKQPLVIQSEKNRDWRGEGRRKRGKKNLLPAEVQALQNGQREDGATVERQEVSTEGGLKIVQKQKVDGNGDTAMVNGQTNGEGGQSAEKKKMTADEEAIAALLGEEKKSTLTILSTDDKSTETNGHGVEDAYTNEADRFRADVDSRPPPASLADYAAVPVEEFGAAILRGLGWKEGEAVGKRGQPAAAPREVKRRPALLGIGAKETPGGVPGDELGAWNQKKGKGGGKVGYNPVMLRNSVTGEMVTEEEMELRKVEAKQGKGQKVEDWRDRRDRNLRVDEGKKRERLAIENADERNRSRASRRERSRDRERERDGRRDREHGSSRRDRTRSRDRSKYGSSRRERSRSMDRMHRRRDDDDYDRRDRDRDSDRRGKDRNYDGRDREKDYDRRNRNREHKRH